MCADLLCIVSKSMTNHCGSDPLTRQWVLIGKANCSQLRSVERVLELVKLRNTKQGMSLLPIKYKCMAGWFNTRMHCSLGSLWSRTWPT